MRIAETLMLAGVLGALWAVPTSGHAQTPEIERLLRHGVELRQRGNDAEALREFERAHRLARTPRTLAQVALAEQALGHWVDADAHLREVLRTNDDASINRNRQALEGALGVVAQHVGELHVTCDVAGAELVVRERVVGTLPMPEPLRVEAGI